MTNFAVTSFSAKGDFDVVLAALETKIETVNNGKNIRLYSIVPRGTEFVGLLVYDT